MAGHDLFLLIRGPTINPFPTCSLPTSQLVASENMSPKITSNLLKHLTPDMNMKEKQTSGVVFPTGMAVPSGSTGDKQPNHARETNRRACCWLLTVVWDRT